MVRSALILITIFLVGCSTTGPTSPTSVVTVDKPVVVYCLNTQDIIPKPYLLIGSLTEADYDKEPGKVVKYWHATVQQLMSVVEQQDKLIRACVKPSDNTKTNP